MHRPRTPCAPRAAFAPLLLLLLAALPRAVQAQGSFLRGNANGDATVDISDALFTLGFLFLGTAEPPCADAADANDDGTIDISDALFTLGFLFLGSAAPPAPGPEVAGRDPRADELGCGPPVERAAYEPPEEPPASPTTAPRVIVRGWDPKQKEVIVGRLLEIEALRIRGRGLDFAWVMTYRSRHAASSAQGHGWDHSYNLRIEREGSDRTAPILLRNGIGRRGDLYERHADAVADAVYRAPGFFNEGREEADGSFTFTFPDGGTWRFHPLDGSPLAGRIEAITDRNGNAVRFDYVFQNNQTNLEFLRIRDTLDREIVAAFDASGRVQTLTDFTGRQVRFDYYQDGEDGGSSGDLKSVSTPPFIVGNDPPVARTTTFTYSTGFADDRLNHNLLTVTDPKGQRAWTFTYSGAADPADPGFDRVTSAVEGEGAARRGLAYVYHGGPFEPFRVIAVDLAGNVEERTYDLLNRLVLLREHTGRSDPSLPVTDTTNRPTGKLRPGDPDVFESTFEWNGDSLLVRQVHPEGNELRCRHASDVDPATRPRSRANLLEVRRLPGPRGGAQPELVERFEYDPSSNQVARAFDPAGNESRHEYDARGNLVRFIDRIPSSLHDFEHNEFGQLTAHVGPDNGSGQRRREEYEYHGPEGGAQNGYLKHVRLRLTPSDSEVGVATDARGNVVEVIDPRGNVWRYAYNELDELVRVTSPPAGSGVPHEIVWDYFRDRNGNVAREDVLNLSRRGSIQDNSHLSRVHEYDALDRLVRRHEEAGSAALGPEDLDGSTLPASQFLTTEYEYDAAGNLAVVRPVGAPGEPVNVVRLEYDERDLLFRRTRGAGSPGAATDQVDYDGNRGRVRVLRAPDFLRFFCTYDGHDRPVRLEDAHGNAEVLEHDAKGNIVVSYTLADSTGDPADVKVRLEERRFEFDDMDRRRSLQILTEAPNPASGRVMTRYEWSDASQLVREIDPNGNETRYAYDDAGRLHSVTDALGNSSTYEYDAASNEVRRVDNELAPDGTASRFETRYAYDALDRRVQAMDNLGRSLEYGHDSRSNLTEVVSTLGDATIYEYDGMSRLVAARRVLSSAPAPSPAVEIIDRLRWDSSSRLVEEIDPNGNSVRHAYDALDRRVATTFADGTVRTVLYDLRDNPVQMTDPNGTIVTCTYDALDRLVRRDIKPGPGVSPVTIFEEYRHDGLSRLLGARNDASTSTFAYDSLSRVTRETLDGRATAYTYDAAGNVVSLTYPGGTAVTSAYDALHREVSVGTMLGSCCDVVQSSTYVGPHRKVRESLNNGNNLNWTFGADRLVSRATHVTGAAAIPVADRSQSWDGMYRQIGRADLLPGGLAFEYTHDAAHRLIQSVFTRPGTPPRLTAYTLDPAGNRVEVTGAVDPGRYLLDPTLPEPADSQVNQYTATPFDQRSYDRNGNLILLRRAVAGRIVEVASSYDHEDRLVEVVDLTTGQSVRFTYDALGRRTAIAAGGVNSPLSYSGRRLLEDSRRGAVYIYSGGHPRVIRTAGQDYHLLDDGTGRTVALTDGQGNLVETYEHGDFGQPRIFDPAGNPSPSSKVLNPFLRDGLEYDELLGLYYVPDSSGHFDPRAGCKVSSTYKLQSGFIYATQPSAARRNNLIGDAGTAMVSDFGMARRGASSRDPDMLVFNVINPRRLAAEECGDDCDDGARKRPGATRYSHICLKRGTTKSKAFFQWVTDAGHREARSAGGYDNDIHFHKRPGRTRYSNIILKRSTTKSKAFFKWVFDAANREVKRMGGKIALCKREGTPVLEWTFERGWPVRWEGPELDASRGGIDLECIEIAHEGLKLASGGFPGMPLRGRVPVSFALSDPEAGGDPARMSDNGWGSCFNCHPFGLEDGVQSSRRGSRQFNTLSNASKNRHDVMMATIQNTR